MNPEPDGFECTRVSSERTICEREDNLSATELALDGCLDKVGPEDGAQALVELAGSGEPTLTTFVNGTKCAVGAIQKLNEPKKVVYIRDE